MSSTTDEVVDELVSIIPSTETVNELHKALLRGLYEGAEAIVSRGLIDINETDVTGASPLIYAAWKGIARLVGKLLELGADATATNDAGFNALHVCSMGGNRATAELLIKAGTDIEGRELSGTGCTPLHIAAQHGDVEIILVLLEYGANIDSRSTSNGETPLYIAASRGEHIAVGVLLQGKADPGVMCMGHTALHIAIKLGFTEVVREIVERVGLDDKDEVALLYSTCSSVKNTDILKVLFKVGAEDTKGNVLCCAVTYGREDCVEFLLARQDKDKVGHYVNPAIDTEGNRSLLDYCFMSIKLFSCRILRRLLDAGMEIEGMKVFHSMDPMTFANNLLADMKEKETYDDDKVCGLEEMIRLFQRFPAVHALSWGWCVETKSLTKLTKGPLKVPIRILPSKRKNIMRGALFRTKVDGPFLGY